MAKKRLGHEMMVYYGAAGSTAATLINANVTDVDCGIGGTDFVDLPDRGDGTKTPTVDQMPVKINGEPKFSMVWKDGDTHSAALITAATSNPQVGKAIKIITHSGGTTRVDCDCWIDCTTPGQLAEGQVVEFTCKPTSAYGRTGFPIAT